MLTKIRLYGVMGRKFGREWELAVNSPAHALRLIEANRPGLMKFIATNKDTYAGYKVTCITADGREEDLNDETFGLERHQLKEIRFSPVLIGASSSAKMIVGTLLIIASFIPGPWTPIAPYMQKLGASLIIGGIIESLSSQPKRDSTDENGKSNYFDGATNTQQQGNPVALIYGRVLIGAQPVSVSISIDEVPA